MIGRQDTIFFLRTDADKRQKDLAISLGRQRGLLQDIQQKLQMLENYLLQYRQQAVAAEKSGILSVQALDMRHFIHQLEQVLQIQKANLEHQRHHVAQLQSQWVTARGQEKGLAALARRLESEQRDRELRKIQRELDEWANRSARF